MSCTIYYNLIVSCNWVKTMIEPFLRFIIINTTNSASIIPMIATLLRIGCYSIRSFISKISTFRHPMFVMT